MQMEEVRSSNWNHDLIFLKTIMFFKNLLNSWCILSLSACTVCCAPVYFHIPTCVTACRQLLPSCASISFLVWFQSGFNPSIPNTNPRFVIHVCDPLVDHFLHGEASGSGESDFDFLPPPYQHPGKSPPPPLPIMSLLSTPSSLHSFRSVCLFECAWYLHYSVTLVRSN